jgi:hypothetical protein
MMVAGVMRQGRFCMSNAGSDPVSDWLTNRAGLEFLLELRTAEQAVEHDPEKHALGLDPRVGTGFPKRSCSNKG